jgi:hypothetical protein
MNKQSATISTQRPSKYHDSHKQLQGNCSNIIPFPTKPVSTGTRRLRQSIHRLLLKAREHVLRHIHITNLPTDGQRNGKYDSSAHTYKRATG